MYEVTDYLRTYASEYNAKRAHHDFMGAGYAVGPLQWDPGDNLYWFEAIPEG